MKLELETSGWRELCAQGLIVAISTAIVVVWVCTKPIVFTYDSFTYIHQAYELQAGRQVGMSPFSRLPLYPAILWALHVTDLQHSVSSLIIFQSCLAIASCWLFYMTARRVEPRGALVLALVFIGSLLPFTNVKHIMTEQTFFFETMLSLYGIVAYLLARTNREAALALVVLAAGTVLMTLTRPQGAFVIPLAFGLAAVLLWPRAWAPLVAAVVAFAVLWSIQAVDRRMRADTYSSAGSLDNSNMSGSMLLFALYGANIRVGPENGAASAELKALLLDELAKPDTLARRVGYLASVPPQDVPAYVDRIFNEPDGNTWTLLSFWALKERLGAKQADRLLVRVSLEAMLAHPGETAWLLIERLYETFFNPSMLVVPSHPQFPAGTFQSTLADEIAAAGDYTEVASVDRTIDRNLRWVMQGAILLALITLPVALRYPIWRVSIALLIFALYLNFTVAAGNHPLFRYAIYAVPMTLLCAYVGIVATASVLRDRYGRKSAR